MTREEFMAHAREEIDRAFAGQRNRMMNLVEQAWAEGKRNAESEAMTEAVREALKPILQPITVTTSWVPDTIPTTSLAYPPYINPIITCDGTKAPEAHYEEGKHETP